MAYVLSLRQPWAELILQGRKTVETRSWNTAFRGEFFIHASKQIDKNACEHFKILASSLKTGVIVGKAVLMETKKYFASEDFLADDHRHAAGFLEFSKPKFEFILKDVRRVEPVECKGALGFFKVKV
jgi:hypothetical protein